MLILLPPSETKRSGGASASLADGVASSWRFPALAAKRTQAADALAALSADPERAAKTLKLSARQLGEIEVNAAVRISATMPAVDRYTGVLFDALDAASLDDEARVWLGEHVAIQTAPFGLVGALDAIPAYRLAAGASVAGIGPQKRFWAPAHQEALLEAAPPFVLDLRSEAYAALGPVPPAIDSGYVRVVAAGEGGAVRALNHFNKHAKGDLVRRLATARPEVTSRTDLLAWAQQAGIELREAGDELQLMVAS